jgi:hypothetical protein
MTKNKNRSAFTEDPKQYNKDLNPGLGGQFIRPKVFEVAFFLNFSVNYSSDWQQPFLLPRDEGI